MRMGVLELVLVLGMGLVTTAMVVVVVVLAIALLRRNRRDQQRTERISRELERINAMAAVGRITNEEAADLRQALEDQRPASADGPARGRLQKSRSAVLCGVCGGLAEWLRWDATLFRLGYVLATFLIAGFPGIIIYIILAIVMPPADGAPRSAARTTAVVLLALLVIPALLLALAALFTGAMRVSHSMGGMPVIHRLR